MDAQVTQAISSPGIIAKKHKVSTQYGYLLGLIAEFSSDAGGIPVVNVHSLLRSGCSHSIDDISVSSDTDCNASLHVNKRGSLLSSRCGYAVWVVAARYSATLILVAASAILAE